MFIFFKSLATCWLEDFSFTHPDYRCETPYLMFLLVLVYPPQTCSFRPLNPLKPKIKITKSKPFFSQKICQMFQSIAFANKRPSSDTRID